jgi:3-isopropylmalate/(R)-2-methylmalate dehydratase large subunit
MTGKDLILYTIGMIGVDGALYKAMEFAGPVIDSLSMDSRFAMANMAIEAGGKFGLFSVDDKTIGYVESKGKTDYIVYKSDDDALFEKVYEIDCSGMGLQVAYPHLPENTRDAIDAKDVVIDQVVIGSCTNGRMEDLRMAAEILKGKKTDRRIRTIIIPATQKIYLQALREGLIEIFIESGCVVSTPTCGPCLGGHMGILAEGERAVATTNRNFVGRMGHPKSEVYLAGPAVAASSAITGNISVPGEVI